MSVADPSGGAVEVVRELARRFRDGDRGGALRLLHPKVRIEQPPSLPHGGWHHGHDGMGAMGATFARYWDRTIDDPRVLGCGPVVVQVTTWSAKLTPWHAVDHRPEMHRLAPRSEDGAAGLERADLLPRQTQLCQHRLGVLAVLGRPGRPARALVKLHRRG